MRTLENFFKHGLTNNLGSRIFKRVYGKLYEETAIASRWAGRSFHDLANDPSVHAHVMPAPGKGLFDAPVVERSPNEMHKNRFEARLVSRIRGALPHRLREALEPRQQNSSGGTWEAKGIHPNGETANSTYPLLPGTLLNWLLQASETSDIDAMRLATIHELISRDVSALAFVTGKLNSLNGIRELTFIPPEELKGMSAKSFGQYVACLRPVVVAITDITTAFTSVKKHNPETTYVYFDNDMRWHYLDERLLPAEFRLSATPATVLESAMYAAIDRGLINQPLRIVV